MLVSSIKYFQYFFGGWSSWCYVLTHFWLAVKCIISKFQTLFCCPGTLDKMRELQQESHAQPWQQQQHRINSLGSLLGLQAQNYQLNVYIGILMLEYQWLTQESLWLIINFTGFNFLIYQCKYVRILVVNLGVFMVNN